MQRRDQQSGAVRAGVRFAEVAERAASFVVYKTSEVRCHVCIHVPCDFSLSCVPKGRLTYWRSDVRCRASACAPPHAEPRPSFAQIGLDADPTPARAPASSGAVRSSTDIPEPPGRAPLRGVSRGRGRVFISYTEVKTPPPYLDQPHAHGPAREIRGTPEESSSSQRHNRQPPAHAGERSRRGCC